MDGLLSWWNLIYLIPLGLGIICWLYAALLWFPVFTAHMAGRTLSPAPAPPATSIPWLAFLGIGRIPTRIVVASLLFIWGLVGILANRIVWGIAENISPMLILSIPLAGAAAYFGTAGLARLFTKQSAV
jgi:hypothetical protein